MHPDDSLILEDESGRVKLGGSALSPPVYVTGIVVSLFFDCLSCGNVSWTKDSLRKWIVIELENCRCCCCIAREGN